MARLPHSPGAIVTEAQLAHLFPGLTLSGTEIEFNIENGKFQALMRGFYSEEEMNVISSDTRDCNLFVDQFREIHSAALDSLDGWKAPQDGNKSYRPLIWILYQHHARGLS